MTDAVIDASAFGPLIVPDEASELIPGMMDILRDGNVVAPEHWPLEIANLMRMSVRRGRLTKDSLPSLVAMLRATDVDIDRDTVRHAWGRTLDYAATHDLTAYDAAYLELAARTRRVLITNDDALIRAAIAENLEVLSR